MNFEETTGPPPRDSAYFDQWYADMSTSTTRDALVTRTLGLPPEVQSTSLLTWAGVAEVTEQLRLPPGGLLLDVACGRGGYGIDVARRTGARLLGIDFSAVALQQARAAAARALPAGLAEFRVGTLLEAGLPAGTADGIMCVDAVQFAEPPLAALVEFRRLLAPGRRLVLSTWQATDPRDPRVSPRIRAVDLSRDLPAAGFLDVEVHDRPDWRTAEKAMWEEAVAAPDTGDPAMRSLQAEGRRSLDAWGSLRRVFAVGTAPQVA